MSVIIDGTNGISDVDGSASTPAIRGTDANTGIFFPAADTIAFTEGGVESMRIDSSGNVGIGTSSPSQRLSVVSTASEVAQFKTNQTNTDVYLTASGTTADGYVRLRGTGDSMVFITGLNERMRIDSSGNVGIGTTSPATKLHVNQTNDALPALQLQHGDGDFILMEEGGGTDLFKFTRVAGTNDLQINNITANNIRFATNNTERMRITSGGDLNLNTTGYTNHILYKNVTTAGSLIGSWASNNSGVGQYHQFCWADDAGWNAGNTAYKIGKVSTTSRSINAAGTVNASGADYAEYMTKSGNFTIAKGDICGIDINGKLTNVFADAISFVVKSTDPSYVGGDTWSCEPQPMKENGDYFGTDTKQFIEWQQRHEEKRALVDRIAFAGQVPVNVMGASAGQYIVPVNDNGAIKGIAVSNPTFEQYQIAVGKVIAIETDGRAKIIVKVA
jgi:hypothetical protein